METKVKHIKHVFPHKIMQYISQNYAKGHLVDIREETTNGQISYKVDITESENLHHLEFSDKGSLLKDEAESLFQRGKHEDFFRDQGFYEKN